MYTVRQILYKSAKVSRNYSRTKNVDIFGPWCREFVTKIGLPKKTSSQSNLAKAASNLCWKSGHQSYVSWVHESLHPKQDLDPSSHVCTAKPRARQTDRPGCGDIDLYSPQSAPHTFATLTVRLRVLAVN